MNYRMLSIGLGSAALIAIAAFSQTLGSRRVALKTLNYTSNPLPIRGLIASMQGPSHLEFKSFKRSKAGLLWVTGVSTAALDGDTKQPLPLSNVCHTVVAAAHEPQKNAQGFSVGENQERQLGVMFPGVRHIQFPKNFAMPLRSDVPIEFAAMGFNQDPQQRAYNLVVEQSLEYFEDIASDVPVKPMYHRMLRLWLPGRDPSSSPEHCEMSHQDGKVDRVDEFNSKNVSHWFVPPGKHVYRYKLEGGLGIPSNTTMHYAYVHLHAHGKSLELRDLTEGRTIFKSVAQTLPNSPDIDKSDIFSSEAGVPVYTDHSYELISEYDNTSNQPVTAMAMMYLYFADHEFLPNLYKLKQRKKQMRDLASAE